MLTLDAMRALIQTRPFVPFRLWISDGGHVDVRSPEIVLLGRRFAVIGLLDPNAKDSLFDRWTTVWYLHVTRVEQIDPGAPPFASPQGPTSSDAAAPI